MIKKQQRLKDLILILTSLNVKNTKKSQSLSGSGRVVAILVACAVSMAVIAFVVQRLKRSERIDVINMRILINIS
jgi:hypothetical protein